MNGFRNFFLGKYGFDALSGAIMAVVLVLSLLSRFWPDAIFLPLIGMGLVVWVFYRTLSTKLVLRRAENEKFLSFWRSLRGGAGNLTSRTQYRYFTCPSCGQKVRVPRGRGRIAITCPRCNAGFIENS
ncbi:MAG: zinc-ribbon domain-containing protein [Angelakisella sp.]